MSEESLKRTYVLCGHIYTFRDKMGYILLEDNIHNYDLRHIMFKIGGKLMELYHATTQIRGEEILRDRCLKKDALRYYSKESGSNGATTQGFVYFTNEITFSIYFANCHNLSESNTDIYIFKVDIPEEFLEPDEDEIKLQSPKNEHIFPNRLAWSLGELKSCRVASDIGIDEYPTQIYRMIGMDLENILKLISYAARPYNYVISNYTIEQKEFLDLINWEDV